MKKNLFYETIYNQNNNFSKEKIKELKHFIRDYEIDEQISKEFPLSMIGKDDDYIPIKGSKELIEVFEKIDLKKIDFKEKLENIEFRGVNEDNEVVLNFIPDKLEAIGTYNFSYNFFDDLFNMGKYEKFCFENELNDLIEDNIKKQFDKFKDKYRQYRLIKKDNNWYIRAITSPVYKNYDNNLAIYLALVLLSKLSIDKKINFNISKAYISDSDIRVFFEQGNYEYIKGVGNVYFGVLLSNSEIKESELSLELYYKLVDKNDSNISFIGLKDIKDSIFGINHTLGIDALINRVNKVSKLVELEKSMLMYIKELGNIKSVSDNVLYNLMLKITKSRMLTTKTRDKFKDIHDKNLINNSMTILQIFNKVDTITNNIEEKIQLQRIYNNVITELIKK